MAIRAKQLQPAKIEAVATAKAVFEEYNDFIFADYRGLTVAQVSALRKQLAEKKAVFKVVKNSYARVAFKDMKIDNVSEYLVGPTAIVLGKEDANEVAKILFDFTKEAPVLQVKGAFVDKELYTAEAIEQFSKLPGKKQLIAMIASTINAPIQKVAATLQAYVDKLQAGGGAVAEPAKEDSAPVVEVVSEKTAEAPVVTEESSEKAAPAAEEKPAE